MVTKKNSWVRDFRKAIKTTVGSGWTVENDRGNMLLNVMSKINGRTFAKLTYIWE